MGIEADGEVKEDANRNNEQNKDEYSNEQGYEEVDTGALEIVDARVRGFGARVGIAEYVLWSGISASPWFS